MTPEVPVGSGTSALLSAHFAPDPPMGSNCHIFWLIGPEPVTTNPPSMYSLLLTTAKPPGMVLAVAGHGSVPIVVIVCPTGSYENTRAVETVAPAAEPPIQ